MATYLLSVHQREGDPVPSEEEMQRAFAQVDAFNTELQAAGQWVFAGGLQPPDTARVVRDRDGQAVVTDGPFAESKEHLGGFWMVEADDLDAAIGLAADGSAACANPVEVRPFADRRGTDVEDDRPQFLLSVHRVEGEEGPQPTAEEQQASWQQMQAVEADMESGGTLLWSARLHGPDTATVVRSQADDDPLIVDGPFAESKEHIAGFYVLQAADLDEALGWGHRVSACVHRPIEVRPFQVEPDA